MYKHAYLEDGGGAAQVGWSEGVLLLFLVSGSVKTLDLGQFWTDLTRKSLFLDITVLWPLLQYTCLISLWRAISEWKYIYFLF